MNKKGKILNIGSVSGINPLSRVFMYSASKAALHNFSKNIAREYGEFGINTNILVPGFFPAEQNKKILDFVLTYFASTLIGTNKKISVIWWEGRFNNYERYHFDSFLVWLFCLQISWKLMVCGFHEFYHPIISSLFG